MGWKDLLTEAEKQHIKELGYTTKREVLAEYAYQHLCKDGIGKVKCEICYRIGQRLVPDVFKD